jgi:glycosyltransferase involved in cell wall biosynthesis
MRSGTTIHKVSIPDRRFRLAVINSHPIPHLVPLYRRLAQQPEIDLTVYYCSKLGVEEYYDPLFGVHTTWAYTSGGHSYKHVFLPNMRRGNNVWGYTSLINPRIISEIWRERYDALWVHSYNYITYLLALITARLRGTPILYRAEHSLTYDSKVHRPFWMRVCKPLFLRLLFKQVKCFLSIGSLNTVFYFHYGIQAHKIFHVPYTVDNDYFARKAAEFRSQREEIRYKMGIGREDVTFLFAAKMIQMKSPLELLRAYERVRMPGKALIIAGDGELRAQAEAYVSERNLQGVHFLGFVNQNELPKYYAISDVFVRFDGPAIGDWGLTVNEAMASGLAMISSDCIAATVDLVKDGENGFVVRFCDIDNLASAMEKMIADPSTCRRMGWRSMEIISKWSYEQCVEGILKALHWIDTSRSEKL